MRSELWFYKCGEVFKWTHTFLRGQCLVYLFLQKLELHSTPYHTLITTVHCNRVTYMHHHYITTSRKYQTLNNQNQPQPQDCVLSSQYTKTTYQDATPDVSHATRTSSCLCASPPCPSRNNAGAYKLGPKNWVPSFREIFGFREHFGKR